MILGFAILLSLFNVSWVRLAVAIYPGTPGHGDCFEFVVPDDFGSAKATLWLLDSCTGDFTYHTVYSFFADLSLSIPAVVVLVWL